MAKSKGELIEEVADLVVEMQNATLAVDQAAAAYLGVNLTDLHCLNLIARQGSMTPGELATAADRTPAAITVVVDRLEQAGLARRTADAEDRRRILVQPTEQAVRQISRLWGPIGDEGVALLARFNIHQLETFAAFLDAGTDLQHRHARRLRQLAHGETQ